MRRRSGGPGTAEVDAIEPAVWAAAFSVVVGAIAVVFDGTIVSVALHDLTTQLHAPLDAVQWVTTGYLLAMFVTIPATGWAQAVLGGKRLWLLSLGIFLAGSVLCAVAWDVTSLIAFRVVQGIGGGIILPLMTTLIVQVSGGRSIGRVMTAVTLPTTLGPIIGPVLGGLILAVADWRWLFLVNVPFCLVGAWLAQRNLAADPPRRAARLDVVGLAVISPGITAIIFGLTQVAGAGGFASLAVGIPLLVGAVLVGAFVVWALRRRAAALIDLRLFRHRALTSGSILGFLAGATLYGAMFLLPLYWQGVRGQDPLGAGLLLIPQSIGTLLSRTLAGRATDRFGPRWVAFTGFVIVTLATIPFAFVTADTNVVLLLVALLIRGAGMGVAVIPLSGAPFIGLAHDDVPGASIITRIAQQLGGSIGTAAIAVVLTLASSGAITADAAGGFGTAFWCTVAVTAVAAPFCLLLPARRPGAGEGRDFGLAPHPAGAGDADLGDPGAVRPSR